MGPLDKLVGFRNLHSSAGLLHISCEGRRTREARSAIDPAVVVPPERGSERGGPKESDLVRSEESGFFGPSDRVRRAERLRGSSG